MDDKNKNRIGYKKTKVGWIPEDWECVRLGRVFERRNARGTEGIPVFSVTQDRGLIGRDVLDRRVETKLSPEDSLLVEPGDIAYNMMRMWQGAVDVCREPCVVSPAYVVCRPRIDRASSTFMLLFFKSPIGLYKLWSYSYGLVDDRLRLYFKDFRLVPAPLPFLLEQNAIAGVLECWDNAIRNYEKKIEKKRNIKKGLMQRLLSGKQRLQGFSGVWKEVRLENVGRFSKGKGISKEEVSDIGLPCIRYGEIYTSDDYIITHFRSFISSKLASQCVLIKQNDLLLAGSGETIDEIGKAIAYMGTEVAYAGGDIIIFSASAELARGDYLSFYLNTEGRQALGRLGQGQSVVHIYARNIANLCIPLPAIEEQKAIAAVLSAADSEIEAMARKLAILKEQKKFLLNNLVTGTIRLPQFRDKTTSNITDGDQT